MFLISKSYWEIRKTRKKGLGVFAKKDIPGGNIIGDYIGKIIKPAIEDISEDNGLFLVYYNDHASILPIDSQKPGVHLINHSCRPNCWIYIYRGHTLFFTLRKIFKDEELTISYLLSPKSKLCNPCKHVCLCDSDNCTKTMHQTNKQYKAWRKFNDIESQKTKRAKITYSKNLEKLPNYPKNIPDNPIYPLTGNQKLPPKIINTSKTLSIEMVRKMIKEYGRTLYLKKQKTILIGVENNRFINFQSWIK